MRKLIVLLMLICLAAVCAPAMAEDDPLMQEAETMVMNGIADLAQTQTGWKKIMMENTAVSAVKKNSKYVTVTVAIPNMKSGVGAKEKPGDDVEGYLQRSLAHAVELDKATEYNIRLTIKGKGDNAYLKWDDAKSLSGYKKKVGSMASAAAKSYVGSQMKSAVYRYLLPKAADAPKKQPDTVPAMESLAAYCDSAAPALGLTSAQANGRLPAMLMLMQLQKIDAAASLNEVTATVKVKDWQRMLVIAREQTIETLQGMMGVNQMTREQVEAVFLKKLASAWVEPYYSKKNIVTEKFTVDLAGAVTQGVGSSGGLMTYLAGYSASCDAVLDELMTFAAAMGKYPMVDLIDSGILAGSEAADGSKVYFHAPEGMHAYVIVRRNGAAVCEGFAQMGDRLLTALQPGTYEVYCSWGSTWYGVNAIFGDESFCGLFSLDVPAGQNLHVTLGEGIDPVCFDEMMAVVCAVEQEAE